MQINLADKRAVVTGGASGIGYATAAMLQRCGADTIVLDKDVRGLERAVARCGFEFRVVDVADAHAVEDCFARLDGEGAVDILVNAAGVLQRPCPPERLSAREWERTIAVDLTGTWLCAVAAGTRMASRRRGAIVNVGSIAGMRSGPLHAYGPAKAALINVTENLAGEWARKGVRVNAVAPGFTDTPAIEKGVHFGVVDTGELAASSAMGRLVAAEEVAAAIVFLASDLASAITGATVPVDAGFLVAGSWNAFGGVRGAPDRPGS